MTVALVVVAYDVADARRRVRLHKTLARFGAPVQFSVFECLVTPEQLDALRAAVARVAHPGDSVRYYEVCAACRRRVVAIGLAVTTRLESVYVL